MDTLSNVAHQATYFATLLLEMLGVAVIVLGFGYSLFRTLRHPDSDIGRYQQLRQDLGRSILLGLELLVAGDIIRTVSVEPTMEGVLVLGMIVLVRTFLSISLEVELEGRWPWKRHEGTPGERDAGIRG
ncbi:MAG: DUF1622 domain-containing protein [Lysobacter spongiicola]|nr:DUF1622 domain-containing protein [Lysobacter spongiicola]